MVDVLYSFVFLFRTVFELALASLSDTAWLVAEFGDPSFCGPSLAAEFGGRARGREHEKGTDVAAYIWCLYIPGVPVVGFACACLYLTARVCVFCCRSRVVGRLRLFLGLFVVASWLVGMVGCLVVCFFILCLFIWISLLSC